MNVPLNETYPLWDRIEASPFVKNLVPLLQQSAFFSMYCGRCVSEEKIVRFGKKNTNVFFEVCSWSAPSLSPSIELSTD